MANFKKYNKKMVERIVGLVKSDTYTIAEVCQLVGVSPATFHRWQDEHEEFRQAIEEANEARMQFFVQEAKKSLLKKIQGYEVTETKVVTVPGKKKDEKDNPKPTIKEQTTTKKHVAPDTAAIIFTLTNGDPKRWKNRHNTEVTGKDGKDLFKTISDEDLDKEIADLEKKLKQ
nr:MAG TPA: terminase small subunit [Caudoviricetes sp.]